MSNRNATMAQARAILAIYEELPAERLQGIGTALLHLVREYLAGEQMKAVNLRVLRQVLGLRCTGEGAWAIIDWSEARPWVNSGSAIIRMPPFQRRTDLVRLRPTDVGVSDDDRPKDVVGLAGSWGYMSVPRGALDKFLKKTSFHGGFAGTAMVPLGDAQYAYVQIGEDGSVREIGQMNVHEPSYATTWSVIMAC